MYNFQNNNVMDESTLLFYQIPKNVMEMNSLSLKAKLVYGLIFTMEINKGEFYASDVYIASKLGFNKRLVQRCLLELRQQLDLEIENPGTKKRKIHTKEFKQIQKITRERKVRKEVATIPKKTKNKKVKDIVPDWFNKEIEEEHDPDKEEKMRQMIENM